MPEKNEKKLTGRHVAMMAAGFAAVVISVNAFFIYKGITTFPGLVVENYYERGRDFNDTLASAQTQSELGWRSGVALIPVMDEQSQLTVVIDHMETFHPITNQNVIATLKRPVHDKEDHTVILTEVAPGVYNHVFPNLPEGRWHIELQTQNKPDQQNYYMVHKVVLKP